MGAADRIGVDLAESEMPDFSLPDQFLHRFGDDFDRRIRVGAVLVEYGERFHAKTAQRFLTDLADIRGGAVLLGHHPFAVHIFVSELGGNGYFPRVSFQGFADEFLVDIRTVAFGGVEQRYTAVDRLMHQPDRHFLIGMPAAMIVQPHAAEAERGNLKSRISFAEGTVRQTAVFFCVFAGQSVAACQLCGASADYRRHAQHDSGQSRAFDEIPAAHA